MGKCKIPSSEELYNRKRKFFPKKDPVWVYLEAEMREKAAKGIKPYNNKVGEWLKFLKDLKYFFYCEAKKKYARLVKLIGPRWYFEFSPVQKENLKALPKLIHNDLLDNRPKRVRKALMEIGLTSEFTRPMLMDAMTLSNDDAPLFIWNLYTASYGQPPSIAKSHYDLNAKLLMSAIVYTDYKECIEELENLCRNEQTKAPVKPKAPPKKRECNVKFGAYLQKVRVPLVQTPHLPQPKSPAPLPMTIKLYDPEYYVQKAIVDAPISVGKRLKRKEDKLMEAKTCTFSFWTAPAPMGNKSGKDKEYAIKFKMYYYMKAKPTYLKKLKIGQNTFPYIQNVSYSGGRPVHVFGGIYSLDLEYDVHNGGMVLVGEEYVHLILGRVRKRGWEPPQSHCVCMERWASDVMKRIDDQVCSCGIRYPYYEEGKAQTKYFHRPTPHGPYRFDHARIFQQDPWEEFIKDEVAHHLREDSTASSDGKVARDLKSWEYLRTFFAYLSQSQLLIPHLPEAYKLNNLQEWVRRRVHGNLTPKQHKNLRLFTERKWVDLSHFSMRTHAHFIPFTEKELRNIDFSHRPMIDKLAQKLLKTYEAQSKKKQVRMAQMWLATMMHHKYPSKSFTETFFSYFPSRLKEVLYVNPYNPEKMTIEQMIWGCRQRTCPLDKIP